MSFVIASFCTESKEERYVSTNGVSTTRWAPKVQRFNKFKDAERWLPEFENSSIRYFTDAVPNLHGFGMG